jgi:alpha-N-arabinofuranosidase
MAKQAKITVHPDYKIGEIDRRLFGAFLEPIGNWVLGGIYNPDHPSADSQGFRKDVIDLTKEFGLRALRYPGGNWTSGWEWENSIGPLKERKAQLDLAWRQYEENIIGHDEYIQWAEKAGTESIYTLNLGSADIKSAFHCLDYTLQPGGTYWSDLRRKYGREKPYDIKTWCLGNELDGNWQIAGYEKEPEAYGAKAHEVAKILKWIRPDAEAVMCGASNHWHEQYPEWDMKMLDKCYETVDHVSIHHYHAAPEGNIDALLNGSWSIEQYIKNEIAILDYLKAKKRSKKTVMVAFDEYGSTFNKPDDPVYWYDTHVEKQHEFRPEVVSQPFRRVEAGKYEMRMRAQAGQMLEALALNSMALTLLRHADRVKIGVMTGLLRACICFDGSHVWKSANYFAHKQLNDYARGFSLVPFIDSPVYPVPQVRTGASGGLPGHDAVQSIEGAASLNPEKEEAAVFFLNRNTKDDIEVKLDLRGFEGWKLVEHTEMYTDDLSIPNDYAHGGKIKPVTVDSAKMEGGIITTVAKKLSWNCVRIKK